MSLWRSLLDRFDLLSLRERVLVMVALVALMVALWDTLLMEPQAKQRKARGGQVEALAAEVEGLEKGIEALVAQGVADPDRQNREAIEALKKEIADIDARMAGTTSGLIAPTEMAKVLEQLLKRTSRLTLYSLRTLPPQALAAATASAATATVPAGDAQAAESAHKIYKHGVELEIGGTYLETLAFLQALEDLPWHFFWDQFEFTVEEHPQGRARLKLYTLGVEEGWIGV